MCVFVKFLSLNFFGNGLIDSAYIHSHIETNIQKYDSDWKIVSKQTADECTGKPVNDSILFIVHPNTTIIQLQLNSKNWSVITEWERRRRDLQWITVKSTNSSFPVRAIFSYSFGDFFSRYSTVLSFFLPFFHKSLEMKEDAVWLIFRE